MTYEERAEESYVKYRDKKCEITRNTNNHLHKDWRKSGVDRHKAYIDGYLDGLAEGRKESEKLLDKLNLQNQRLNELKNENDYLRNDFIYIIQDKTKRALLKENAELNRDKTELVNSVTELKDKVTELKKQIEKIKCCQMCKYLEDNGSCLRADKDEVNKWGDFLIGTRRKNHCKYWEIAE